MKKTLVTIAYILCTLLPAWAQTDTLFWFAAPEMTQGVLINRSPTVNQNIDRPIQLRITAYAQPAVVTITQPAGIGGAYMTPQTVNVPAGGTQSFNLTAWIDSLECKPADKVLNYGLKISSSTPVSIYYEIVSAQCLCGPTIFVLKGQNALGTDFWIPSQNYVDNGYHPGSVPVISELDPKPYSSFDIVATEDNTVVTINPRNSVVGHAGGTAYSITLNKGQTYSATAAGVLPAQHLDGSRVTSTKPIAITYKDDMLRDNSLALYPGGCGDPGGDQLVPTPILGTEYIAIKGNLTGAGDQLFVTATQNATDIYQDGTYVNTINAGQTLRLPIAGAPGASTFLRTSNAAAVLQLTGYGCEMDVAVVPKNNCESGSRSVSIVRAVSQPLYLHLTVKNGGQGNFLVNGAAGVITAAQFTAVPGTSGQWYAAWVLLSSTTYPQGSVVNVQNTSSLFHLGMFNGQNQTGAGGARFGYFSNFGQINAVAKANSNQVCAGDTIKLYADTVSSTSAIYTWTGPNNYGSAQQNPVINNPTSAASGVYTLNVDVPGCSRSTDTILVKVFNKPVVALGNDTAICADSLILRSLVFYATPSYLWSNAATSSSIVARQTGKYWLEVTENGCKSSDTMNLELNTNLNVDLGNDINICRTELPLVLESIQPAGTKYAWSTGLVTSSIQVNYSGVYWLSVLLNGCKGSDTIRVAVVEPPVVDIGRDSAICEQFPLRIGTIIPDVLYKWSTGETTSHINVSSTGTYILEVTLQSCVVKDTINITAMPAPDIDLGPNTDICQGQTIVLNAQYGNNSRYLWNMGDTTATYTAIAAGLYAVRVVSEYKCVSVDTILLRYFAKPTVILPQDTTVCEETPLTLKPVYVINEASLLWSNGSTERQLSITEGGQYIINAINKCGNASDTVNIRQIFCDIWLPNAFTPNGDGVNDILKVLGNIGRLQDFSFSIYNRWGELVFTTNDKYHGWDGKQNSEPASLDTYVYMLQYSLDGKPVLQKGNVTLIR